MSFEVALLIALAMLLGNAFFVGAEFGLISARRSSIELKALAGSKAAKITLGAMERVTLMLAGAQLGVTICSLILGAVGEPLFANILKSPFEALGMSEALLHPISVLCALILMIYLHVVIGEMVPKNIALADPDRAAIILTPPLVFIVKITRPFVALLNMLASICLKLVGIKQQKEIPSTFTRDEVAGFVEESKREGLLSEYEGSLLSGALQFDERTVSSVLLPLSTLVIAPFNATAAQIEKLTSDTGFSRFPVQDSAGNLSNYVHIKDILLIADAAHDQPIPAIKLRPLESFSSRTSLRTALATMQRTGVHLANIANKDGVILGIIALEDLLEEFVGEISDDNKQDHFAKLIHKAN